MILSQEHRAIIASKINKLWKKSKECSVCGEEKWNLSDKIFAISHFGPEDQKNKQLYPVVVLTCANCGNSLFFNAMSLGISFDKKKEDRHKN